MPRPERMSADAVSYDHLTRLYGVPDDAQSLAVRHMLAHSKRPCLFVTHHDRQLSRFVENAPFFLPDIPVIALPAWDTLPYDRAAPSRSVVAQRVAALTQILQLSKSARPFIVATTASAFLQKLPPKELFADASFTIEQGSDSDRETLGYFLQEQGYRRMSKVMEPGEYAMRGSIVDIFPSNTEHAYRVDFFGDTIESIASFDPLSQRSNKAINILTVCATSELILNDACITRFKKRYTAEFGAPHRDDALYHTVSQGNYYTGMEQWLPYYYERMDHLLDYLPAMQIALDRDVLSTLNERSDVIEEYYQARKTGVAGTIKGKQPMVYHPISPTDFYAVREWERCLDTHHTRVLEPFEAPANATSLDVRAVAKPYVMAKSRHCSPFEVVQQDATAGARPIIIAGNTTGSCERLEQLMAEQDVDYLGTLNHINKAKPTKAGLYIAELSLSQGFQCKDFAIYSEEDLLGRRIIGKRKKRPPSDTFLAEAAAFNLGELLVHKDHGIGCFAGLETLEVNGTRHDCLKLHYRDNDRLFVPVENIELITRHGGDPAETIIDKLGSGNWATRKAAYKEKLRLTAEALLETAAQRELTDTIHLSAVEDVYGDFAARFPYEETDDQDRAINEVLDDLQGNKPMDRLVCGDVGFGKTEVAIRAAFVAATDAVNPVQVAFIAPTTLLVRQHYHSFKDRFVDTGINVAQLSRLCSAAETKRVKEGLADGSIDIVIGTHALLADSVSFNNLGLLIVDEEQRFGVKQKEKLKNAKSSVHVLTMSATPIPRTLQMSLTGVRDLSLITTPPVDRLAIRSFVMPFDPIVLQEAIRREIHRGGQVFYVTPRIADLPELQARIQELAPDARLAVAHGQMSASELDTVMNEVYDGKFDILLSTAIIESGIDIPSANTMIIHRADRFGLAQLYQLRGRVGRGKVRAYAYFTLPFHGAMSAQAIKRLEVMQSLDTLGAGFSLASHDMDIRGFGNLVGEEQSGHVKDVGVEMYQQMLADAVRQARLKREDTELPEEADDWSPQLNLGLSVLIPEEYVDDLSLRLSLYRRAATLETEEEVESFAAELTDRFGSIPEEAQHLFTTLKLKQRCKQAGIARVDTGPKGAVVHFHETAISNPRALVGYIAKHSRTMKLRADQSVFFSAEWKDNSSKLRDLRTLIDNLGQAQQTRTAT